MNPSSLDQLSRTQLLQQLVYLDEEKMNLLDQHFPERNRMRRIVEKTLSEYCSTLERIVNDLEAIHDVALIGSWLDLKFLDDGSSESFTIVFPNLADPDKNLISFLSPLAFQLLMARTEETYTLVIPSGETKVKVEHIKFVNRGDLN